MLPFVQQTIYQLNCKFIEYEFLVLVQMIFVLFKLRFLVAAQISKGQIKQEEWWATITDRDGFPNDIRPVNIKLKSLSEHKS